MLVGIPLKRVAVYTHKMFLPKEKTGWLVEISIVFVNWIWPHLFGLHEHALLPASQV